MIQIVFQDLTEQIAAQLAAQNDICFLSRSVMSRWPMILYFEDFFPGRGVSICFRARRCFDSSPPLLPKGTEHSIVGVGWYLRKPAQVSLGSKKEH